MTGHEPLLEAADAAAVAVLGKPLRREGMNARADSGLVQAAGIPTLLVGPMGGNCHALDEWVSLPEVVQSVEITRRTAEAFCR